jgi:NAD(P)-dependent dehydrogenase (short-subunit alcohol dehydrogenase family)
MNDESRTSMTDRTSWAFRRVVVVTGASAGVGRATARAFAAAGADVGLIARGRAGLEAAKRDVEAAGGRAVVVVGDVANADDVEHAADAIERELGPIDVWVNNAMATIFGPVEELAPDEYRRIIEVTHLGTVYGTMAALERMRRRNRGMIIQVGSALAYRSIPLQSAYCAAKHATQGFTESLRSELLHDKSGIRISMVHLPALNTPQFQWGLSRLPRHPQPVPPIYQPEVAAGAIVWASEHYRPRIMVGLPTTLVTLANKVVPGLLDHYLAKTNYQAQQTDLPYDPGRPANLWEPLDDDRDVGAHGPFDDRSRSTSPQFWLTKHRSTVATAGLGTLALAGALLRGVR